MLVALSTLACGLPADKGPSVADLVEAEIRAPLALAGVAPDRIEVVVAAHVESLVPVLTDRVVYDAAVALGGGAVAGRTLAAQGIARLPDEELIRWNESRIVLGRTSEPLCAAMWTGADAGAHTLPAVAAQDDAWIRAWVRRQAEAMRSEAYGGPVEIRAGAIEAAGAVIGATLSEVSFERYARVVQQGTGASDADACWALLTTLEASQALEAPLRSDYLRAMSRL